MSRLDSFTQDIPVQGRKVNTVEGGEYTLPTVTVREGRIKTVRTGRVTKAYLYERSDGMLTVCSAMDRYGSVNVTFSPAWGSVLGEKRYSIGKVNWKGQTGMANQFTLTNSGNGLVKIECRDRGFVITVDLEEKPLFIGQLSKVEDIKEALGIEA